MDLNALTKPLDVEDIDFRIQSITKSGYAIILAYKNARVDMNRLDMAVGSLYWKREHLNGNANCIVSIWNNEIGQWVSKEDTGKESFTEKEKGLASDSFKRACFNWGIGRELYDFPFIIVQLLPEEFTSDAKGCKATNKLKLKDWRWKLERSEDNKLTYLGAIHNQKLRFQFGKLK